MTRSGRFAATAGSVTGTVVALVLQLGLGIHPILAVSTGLFSGIATGCGIWAGPIVSIGYGEGAGTERLAAVYGGLSSTLGVIAFAVPMMVLEAGFPTGFGFSLYGLSLAVAGLFGASALQEATRRRGVGPRTPNSAPAD